MRLAMGCAERKLLQQLWLGAGGTLARRAARERQEDLAAAKAKRANIQGGTREENLRLVQ